MQNSYKKSGVDISLANNLVRHIASLSKKNVKKKRIIAIEKRYNWRLWTSFLILVI